MMRMRLWSLPSWLGPKMNFETACIVEVCRLRPSVSVVCVGESLLYLSPLGRLYLIESLLDLEAQYVSFGECWMDVR